MHRDDFVVGVDMGTSKTAIVASNGRREVLPSLVGWPKDHVARRLLGRDVLFGQEVLEHRLALHVVRPFEKGFLKYGDLSTGGSAERIEEHKQAARALIRHAVSLVRPPEAARIRGVIGAPSRASYANQQILIEAAETVMGHVLVVPEPFAVAFGIDRLESTLVVDIGAGTTDICPMCGAFPSPEDQVTLSIGGDAVDEEFHRRLCERHPEARPSFNLAREIKERHGGLDDLSDRVLVTLPTDDESRDFDVAEPLHQACQMVVAPIVEGIRAVLRRVDPEYRPALLRNILLSGGGSQLKGLDRALEAALGPHKGAKVSRVYDWLFAGAIGAYGLAMSMTTEQWQVVHRVERRSPEPAACAAAT